jgi:hypothetical protein
MENQIFIFNLLGKYDYAYSWLRGYFASKPLWSDSDYDCIVFRSSNVWLCYKCGRYNYEWNKVSEYIKLENSHKKWKSS